VHTHTTAPAAACWCVGLVALTGVACSGCKKGAGGSVSADAAPLSDPTPDDPDVDPPRDVLLAEQRRIRGGEDVGAHLRAPEVSVGLDGVVVNGRRLLARGALPAGSVRRVDEVWLRLKAYREHWLQINPAKAFDGHAEISIQPAIDDAAAVSVLLSAASAGYPSALVKSGNERFEARWNVPARPFDPPVPVRAIVRLSADASGYHLRFGASSTRDVPALANLDAALSATCEARTATAGRCVDMAVVVASPDAEFGELAREASALLGTPTFARDPPRLDFELPGHVPSITADVEPPSP
jgi:hypothetical protein